MPISIELPDDEGRITVEPSKTAPLAIVTLKYHDLDAVGFGVGKGGYVCDSQGHVDKTDAVIGKVIEYTHPVSKKVYLLQGTD